MELEQQFELPVAPDAVWPAFQDLELLVTCLPGASLTGPAVDGALPMRFEVKLGPIAAVFVGTGRVTLDQSARSGQFEGTASDKRTNSRVRGEAHFQLEPLPPVEPPEGKSTAGSVVKVRVDYNLTGSLAQFSRAGLVRELASALTAQFASNLAKRLPEKAPEAAAQSLSSPRPAPPPRNELNQPGKVIDFSSSHTLENALAQIKIE